MCSSTTRHAIGIIFVGKRAIAPETLALPLSCEQSPYLLQILYDPPGYILVHCVLDEQSLFLIYHARCLRARTKSTTIKSHHNSIPHTLQTHLYHLQVQNSHHYASIPYQYSAQMAGPTQSAMCLTPSLRVGQAWPEPCIVLHRGKSHVTTHTC